jgi:lysyl endopeptidase
LRIVSDNALSNFLIFDSFFIPEGARFFVYNDSVTQSLGAYTFRQNREDNRMSLGPIIGNAVTLEYYQPKTVSGASIHTMAFIHSFKPTFSKSLGQDFGNSGVISEGQLL